MLERLRKLTQTNIKQVASAIGLILLMVSLWVANPTPAQAVTKPCGQTFNLTQTDPVCVEPWLFKGPIDLQISCDVEPQEIVWFPGGNECSDVLRGFRCDPQHGAYRLSCFPKSGNNFPLRITESPNGSVRIDFLNG